MKGPKQYATRPMHCSVNEVADGKMKGCAGRIQSLSLSLGHFRLCLDGGSSRMGVRIGGGGGQSAWWKRYEGTVEDTRARSSMAVIVIAAVGWWLGLAMLLPFNFLSLQYSTYVLL